jgi:hypothetical protein
MKVFRSIISLFFLIIVCSIFIVGREFLLIKPIENLVHVPQNATFAMRIDGTAVVKAAAFSIILEANDPDLIEVINAQINEKRRKKGKSKNLGIDYLSDLVIYSMPFESGQILGVTYNLNRPDLMRKNAGIVFDNNEAYSINGKIAVVLVYKGETALEPQQKVKMINLAKKIAFQPSRSQLSEKLSKRETNKIVQLTSKGQLFGKATLFNRSDIDLILENHGLKVSGRLMKNRLENRAFTQPKYTLPPSGLHFYTTLIPDKIQDTIHDIFDKLNLELPKIKAISLNLRGSTINNTERNLVYSPDFDILITFQQAFEFKVALLKSQVLKELKIEAKDGNFTNRIKDYYFTRIDSKTYLISSRKNVKPTTLHNDCLLFLEGKLDPLTNVAGDKMILFFLENLPIFKTTKDFFSKTEGLKIEIIGNKNNLARLRGKFTFKKEYYPLNEFLKYSIQNNFIRVK